MILFNKISGKILQSDNFFFQREALAFATEPIFASLANVLGAHDNIAGASKFLADFQLYEVELKHGMLQVCKFY